MIPVINNRARGAHRRGRRFKHQGVSWKPPHVKQHASAELWISEPDPAHCDRGVLMGPLQRDGAAQSVLTSEFVINNLTHSRRFFLTDLVTLTAEAVISHDAG